MKSKFSIYIPIILCVLLFAAFIPALAAQSPMAATHTVCTSGCDFTSIQTAIEAANPGTIKWVPEYNLIMRADAPNEDKVSIIQGSGSGGGASGPG